MSDRRERTERDGLVQRLTRRLRDRIGDDWRGHTALTDVTDGGFVLVDDGDDGDGDEVRDDVRVVA